MDEQLVIRSMIGVGASGAYGPLTWLSVLYLMPVAVLLAAWISWPVIIQELRDWRRRFRELQMARGVDDFYASLDLGSDQGPDQEE